jgi:hypothetical protein
VDQAVDGIFVYVADDSDVGQRIPEDPAEVLPGGSELDLGPHLPLLEGEVRLEVWGRQGLDAVFLGRLTVPASDLPGTALELRGFGDDALDGGIVVLARPGQPIQFEWRSAEPLTQVRWQVLPSEPAPADVSLNPPGLLGSGSAPADGDGRTGSFSIDLDTLADGGALAQLGGTPEQGVFDAVTEAADAVGDAVEAVSGSGVVPTAMWVRVLPYVGDQPGYRASNPVEVVNQPPTAEPPSDTDAPYRATVSATIPPAPNPDLQDCVRILEEIPPAEQVALLGTPGFGSVPGIGLSGAFSGPNPFLPYQFDDDRQAIYPFTVCPGDIRGTTGGGGSDCSVDPTTWGDCAEDIGEALEDLGTLIAQGVEAISNLVEEAKGAIVDAVAGLVCPDEVAGPCRAVLMTGLNALISATTGLPPSLPNFDDLAGLAKGEIVDLALDQVNLSEACDAVAGAATGKSCGEVVTALVEQDMCGLAPEGSEDECDELLAQAQAVCEGITGASEGEAASECSAVTADAQEILEAGARAVIEEGYDALVEQTRRKASQAVIAHSGMPLQWPGRETIVVPEPLGFPQPVSVQIDVETTGRPEPEGGCGPLVVELDMVSEVGPGQPYYPETVAFPVDGSVMVFLDQPNQMFAAPPEFQPPPPDPVVTDVGGGLGQVQHFGHSTAADWKLLLAAGSTPFVGVSGDCIDAVTERPPPVPAPAAKPQPGVGA